MKLRVIHIFAVCAALSFFVGCSCNKPNIIPRGKMAHIYAEMLVVDQWLLEHMRYRSQADTSLVYEPIFESYGYTTEDYRASVEYYMNDPERYSRILRNTSEILQEKIEELTLLKAKEDKVKAIVPYRINPDRLYFGRSKDRLWEYGDSVSAALDSVTPVYELGFHEVSDTVFDGLNMIINVDTLAVKDTISVEKPEPAKVESAPKEVSLEKPVPVEKQIPVERPALPVKKAGVKADMALVTLDSLKRK